MSVHRRRLIFRFRYLLLLFVAYGITACAFGIATFLIVALMARPGTTAAYLSGVATGVASITVARHHLGPM